MKTKSSTAGLNTVLFYGAHPVWVALCNLHKPVIYYCSRTRERRSCQTRALYTFLAAVARRVTLATVFVAAHCNCISPRLSTRFQNV